MYSRSGRGAEGVSRGVGQARAWKTECPSQGWVLTERWVEGKVQAIQGEEELETRVSYFLGNDPAKHRSGLTTYRCVSLGEVWPGVEVKLKATQKTVEKLFYVAAGAEVSRVVLEIEGGESLRLGENGELIVGTGAGGGTAFKAGRVAGAGVERLPVGVAYRFLGPDRYGFEVEGVDPTLPTVIDPILQSTYLGGTASDLAFTLDLGPGGEVYIAGWTASTNFPNTTVGA